LFPTLFHRLLITLRHQPELSRSRSAPSGGRSWKGLGDREAPDAGAAEASGYSSGT